MSDITVVIGGGFGDEGKGLMTDYYADKTGGIVVRFNGGAQAGHTVTTPEEKRHIFSHFGAGTFSGASTYLSEFFVANPLLFKKEYELFQKISDGMKVNIFAHPAVLVSSMFDMLLNHQIETQRGPDLHGSVGVGFGETIKRAESLSSLTIGDLRTITEMTETDGNDLLFEYFDKIRTRYVPTRVNLSKVSATFLDILKNDDLIFDMIKDLQFMMSIIRVEPYTVLRNDTPLIFEGAQGLLLDQDYGRFPHVTRSNTGMRNVQQIMTHLSGNHNVVVNYVTRAYNTRHGAGPLDMEEHTHKTPHKIIDKTNRPNEWKERCE